MALEDLTGTKYINSLISTNPTSTDNKSDGDDHIRGIKNVLKTTFPSVSGAVTATHTELNLLDGVTSTTAELNILDGVTSTAAELNILDGVTSTAAELNLVDGSVAGTAVASKALVLGANKNVDTLAIADGGLKLGSGAGIAVTATAAELNILDGVTATAAELNLLDGVTGPLKGAFRGALVYNTTTVNIANSTHTVVPFANEIYDITSIHSDSTNTSRLTVPTGVTKVRLSCQLKGAIGSSGAWAVAMLKNGAESYPGEVANIEYAPFTGHISLMSPILAVVAGDYFEIDVIQSSVETLGITRSWFQMEIIE